MRIISEGKDPDIGKATCQNCKTQVEFRWSEDIKYTGNMKSREINSDEYVYVTTSRKRWLPCPVCTKTIFEEKLPDRTSEKIRHWWAEPGC